MDFSHALGKLSLCLHLHFLTPDPKMHLGHKCPSSALLSPAVARCVRLRERNDSVLPVCPWWVNRMIEDLRDGRSSWGVSPALKMHLGLCLRPDLCLGGEGSWAYRELWEHLYRRTVETLALDAFSNLSSGVCKLVSDTNPAGHLCELGSGWVCWALTRVSVRI